MMLQCGNCGKRLFKFICSYYNCHRFGVRVLNFLRGSVINILTNYGYCKQVDS